MYYYVRWHIIKMAANNLVLRMVLSIFLETMNVSNLLRMIIIWMYYVN